MTHHCQPKGHTSPCKGGNNVRLLHNVFTTQQAQKTKINGDEPILIQGHSHDICVHRIYYDSGSSIEIMYEHNFSKLPETMKKMLR